MREMDKVKQYQLGVFSWSVVSDIDQNGQLVFAGPVHWTGKKTEIELNPTAKDRTTGCGCTNSEFLWLPVATFVEKSENRKKPVFVPSCVGPYLRTFLPNCRSLNHKKRSRIG